MTVKDTTQPAITAPANISAFTDPGECFATGLSLGTPTTSDNCTVSSVTNDAPAQFPVGTTFVTWTVTDIHGNTETATQTVTVTDAEPPNVSAVSASPSMLWTPNHTLRDVALAYTATDNCGAVGCAVTSVTSNEPPDGTGDGDTAPDFEIVGPSLVRLRAERSGGGNGRQYTVTVTCSDGTSSTGKSVVVTVPKGQDR